MSRSVPYPNISRNFPNVNFIVIDESYLTQRVAGDVRVESLNDAADKLISRSRYIPVNTFAYMNPRILFHCVAVSEITRPYVVDGVEVGPTDILDQKTVTFTTSPAAKKIQEGMLNLVPIVYIDDLLYTEEEFIRKGKYNSEMELMCASIKNTTWFTAYSYIVGVFS